MSNPTRFPFLDLVAPHKELVEQLLAVVNKAFDTAGFIGGAMVEAFEQEFGSVQPYKVLHWREQRH